MMPRKKKPVQYATKNLTVVTPTQSCHAATCTTMRAWVSGCNTQIPVLLAGLSSPMKQSLDHPRQKHLNKHNHAVLVRRRETDEHSVQ
jgi:hypothetical protein